MDEIWFLASYKIQKKATEKKTHAGAILEDKINEDSIFSICVVSDDRLIILNMIIVNKINYLDMFPFPDNIDWNFTIQVSYII